MVEPFGRWWRETYRTVVEVVAFVVVLLALAAGAVWVLAPFSPGRLSAVAGQMEAVQSCPPCPDPADLCAVVVDRAVRATAASMDLGRFRYDDVTLWQDGRCIAGTYRHNGQRFDCATHPAANGAWSEVRVVTGLSVVDLDDGKGPFISADVVLRNPVDGGVR